jgi:hypothetical protein
LIDVISKKKKLLTFPPRRGSFVLFDWIVVLVKKIKKDRLSGGKMMFMVTISEETVYKMLIVSQNETKSAKKFVVKNINQAILKMCF